MSVSMLDNLKSQPDAARALANYRELAAGYDDTCTRIEALRRRAIAELALRPGECVFDIGCGTGPTLPLLAQAVGPTGRVIGVELSPEMAALAQQRIAASGHAGEVRVIQSALETLQVEQRADALLLCYTHDVLQSGAALQRLIQCAKPGARIAVLGMKTLPWLWGWPVNLFNLYRARRYLTTYANLDCPWRMLQQRGATLRETHTALCGSAYIASGRLPNMSDHKPEMQTLASSQSSAHPFNTPPQRESACQFLD